MTCNQLLPDPVFVCASTSWWICRIMFSECWVWWALDFPWPVSEWGSRSNTFLPALVSKGFLICFHRQARLHRHTHTHTNILWNSSLSLTSLYESWELPQAGGFHPCGHSRMESRCGTHSIPHEVIVETSESDIGEANEGHCHVYQGHRGWGGGSDLWLSVTTADKTNVSGGPTSEREREIVCVPGWIRWGWFSEATLERRVFITP